MQAPFTAAVQLSVNLSVPKVCCASPWWDLSGDPGVHCRESQRLPSRKAQFPLQHKCMITTDVSSSHPHAKKQYSGLSQTAAGGTWPIHKPAPSSEVVSWRNSSYPLFFSL